jgi:hypothetical protein
MRYVACCMTCLVALIGCGPFSQPTLGGTPGTLTAGELRIPDFEVKIFETGSTKPLAVGTTDGDGKFQLVQPKGEGPFWLLPGEYGFTLDSVGPSPPRMPANYSNPSKTPLKVKWKPDDKTLDLRIPALK